MKGRRLKAVGRHIGRVFRRFSGSKNKVLLSLLHRAKSVECGGSIESRLIAFDGGSSAFGFRPYFGLRSSVFGLR